LRFWKCRISNFVPPGAGAGLKVVTPGPMVRDGETTCTVPVICVIADLLYE
jgi:hypothetical protein